MKPTNALIAVAVSSILSLTSTSLLAHGGENHDNQKPTNGGQLRVAGEVSFELVVAKDHKEAKEGPVIVHVTDHAGAKIPTAGATGTATLLAGKQKATVTLTPDGDNRMKGNGQYASTADMKVVVSIGLAGKGPQQARFTPLVAGSESPTAQKH